MPKNGILKTIETMKGVEMATIGVIVDQVKSITTLSKQTKATLEDAIVAIRSLSNDKISKEETKEIISVFNKKIEDIKKTLSENDKLTASQEKYIGVLGDKLKEIASSLETKTTTSEVLGISRDTASEIFDERITGVISEQSNIKNQIKKNEDSIVALHEKSKNFVDKDTIYHQVSTLSQEFNGKLVKIPHGVETFVNGTNYGRIPSVNFIGDGIQVSASRIDVPVGGESLLSELGDVSITNPQDGQALVYNETTGKWENGQGSDSGGGSPLTITPDPDGTTTVFTLSPTPHSHVLLWKNGQLLAEDIDYTISGTTVTFTDAPLADDYLFAFAGVDPMSDVVNTLTSSDGTLTLSSSTGDVDISLNLAHANTWTGQQTFNSSAPILGTITQGSVLFAGTGGVISQDNSNLFYDATNDYLGIGTNSPIRRLQSTVSLGAGVEADALLLQNKNNSDNSIVALAFSNNNLTTDTRVKASIGFLKNATFARGDLVFSINNTADNSNVSFTTDERMRITAAGLVGIGTSVPGAKLHISSTGNVRTRIESTDSSSYPGFEIVNPDISWGFFTAGPSHDFWFKDLTHNETPFIIGSDAGSNLLSLKSGMVGIGTTSPTAKLDVSSDISVPVRALGSSGYTYIAQTNSTTNGNYAGIGFTVSTTLPAVPQAGIRGVRGSTFANTDLVFTAGADTERMRIFSSGHVTIGSTSSNPSGLGDTSLLVATTASSGRTQLDLSGNRTGANSIQAQLAGYRQSSRLASIDFVQGSNNTSGYIQFDTSISGTLSVKMTLQQDGVLTLTNALNTASGTFSSVPSSPISGMIYNVTDSTTNTWGATITGGGSYSVLAFYNGTNWTVMGI